MPVVLEWAKAVVSPRFYWRNVTWTRYSSPVVPRREEFESSDKQSREPPEKYNYGERCIRCAEAIFPSPNALWNRRASFELKNRSAVYPHALGSRCMCKVRKRATPQKAGNVIQLALHFTVHPNMDRRSVLLFLGHRTPRASLGRVPCIKKSTTGPGSDLRRGRTRRAGNAVSGTSAISQDHTRNMFSTYNSYK